MFILGGLERYFLLWPFQKHLNAGVHISRYTAMWVIRIPFNDILLGFLDRRNTVFPTFFHTAQLNPDLFLDLAAASF